MGEPRLGRAARHLRVDGAGAPSVDGELLDRMRIQDAGALTLLYDRWAPLLHPFVLHLLGDAAAAEDVVEETFWQAWQQANRYDAERGEVSTWLFTIGRGRALMQLRARRRRREEALPPADSAALLTPAMDPASNADAADRRARVIAAMAELPSEQRQAVDLAFFHGFTQQEIADRLGQPLGTVKTRTRLAFDKLRRLLSTLADRAA